MWESLFGSAVAPAIEAGVGEAAMQSITPALTDTAIDTGLTNALTGTGLNSLGQSTAGLGMDATFQALGNNAPMFTVDGMLIPTTADLAGQMTAGVGTGMFDSLGDYGKMLTSDQAGNVFKALGSGYGIYNQGKAMNNANEIQRAQLAQSQDAYNRDKSADQRRQKLVF